MTAMIAIDANVLVAWIDDRDKWHAAASALRDGLEKRKTRLIYLDCVINETISVLARRTEEQKRTDQLDSLLNQLATLVPVADITWISREGQRLYNQITDMVRHSGGALNFNDALIALICRERGVTVLTSFDKDFDKISWLTRIEDITGLSAFLQRSR